MDELLLNIKNDLESIKVKKRLAVVYLAQDLKEGKIGTVKLSDLSNLSRTDIEKLIDNYFNE